MSISNISSEEVEVTTGNTKLAGGTSTEQVELGWTLYNPGAQGEPLILVMGWSGVQQDWGDLPRALSTNRPVLVYDHRGMGASKGPDDSLSLMNLVEDLNLLIQERGWSNVDLMGISMGGMIAQQYALRYPKIVHKLVLGCSSAGGEGFVAGGFDPLAMFQNLRGSALVRAIWETNFTAQWISQHKDEFEGYVTEGLKYRRPARMILRQMFVLAEHQLGLAVQALTMPTLLVHGESDQVLPLGNSKFLAHNIENSSLLVLRDAGHMFWLSHPECSSEILLFLNH